MRIENFKLVQFSAAFEILLKRKWLASPAIISGLTTITSLSELSPSLPYLILKVIHLNREKMLLFFLKDIEENILTGWPSQQFWKKLCPRYIFMAVKFK